MTYSSYMFRPPPSCPHARDMTHAYLRHDSYIRGTQLIRMFDMTDLLPPVCLGLLLPVHMFPFPGCMCCSLLQPFAACCSLLQPVAACCSLLQPFAAFCSLLQPFAAFCSLLQRCSLWQCVAVCSDVLQCVALWQCIAEWCSALQCDAVCCSVALKMYASGYRWLGIDSVQIEWESLAVDMLPGTCVP